DYNVNGSIFEYGANALNKSLYIPLHQYAGKYILIVNVSFPTCPSDAVLMSLSELNALHDELKDLGFTILGFPCNQFGLQEPGNNHEILPTLKYVRPGNGFVPNFQLFERGDVNGLNEQKLFTFLKSACPPVGDSFGNPSKRLFWEPLKINDIKWNFEKFLVAPDGKPVMRWFPRVNVSEVRADILKHLRQQYSKH
uniref:glutathione peroxidase n=1 Tax=Electrophorus electricus TaxID=8005 RepID=A0AAY5EEI0_ELEEL